MPISTSSFGDERDNRYAQYQAEDDYESETLACRGVSAAQAENWLKRLGGGVEEKLRIVSGIGWTAEISELAESADGDAGVTVLFRAHDELLDDLVRRYEEWMERGA